MEHVPRGSAALNSYSVKTVLASRPGVIQSTLRATLASFPEIVLSGSASGGLSALHTVAQVHPALLVIDNNLSEEEVESLLHDAKVTEPQLHCVVLVDTVAEQRKSLASGADIALIRDNFARQLHPTMERLGLLDLTVPPPSELLLDTDAGASEPIGPK